jgi:hypothetical protein
MVSSYIRKGGHSGDHSKAGLPTGYWQERSRRAAAAAAKAAANKAKELLEEEAARRRPPTAGGSGPSTVMSSSRPVISCKQCIARLVSLDCRLHTQMTTQLVLVADSRVLRRVV